MSMREMERKEGMQRVVLRETSFLAEIRKSQGPRDSPAGGVL